MRSHFLSIFVFLVASTCLAIVEAPSSPTLMNVTSGDCERDFFQKYSLAPAAPWRPTISQNSQGQSEIIEAAPSNEIGIWLEKRKDDQNRSTEIRKVSVTATEKFVFNLQACELISRLSYQRKPKDGPAVMNPDFTDEKLKSLVRSSAESVIYAWSPNMPLSLKGLKEIRAAAEEMHISVTYVLDPTISEKEAWPTVESYGLPKEATQHIESVDLFYRGMALHYPTALFIRNGAIVGSAVHGFHSAHQFTKIMKDKRVESAALPTYVHVHWVDVKMAPHQIKILNKVPIKNKNFYFFRPIFNTHFVALSHHEDKLYDLERRREVRLPCCADPTPTPDAKYLVIPTSSQDDRGEACFYEMDQILAAAPDASEVKPILCDPQIRSDYLFAAAFKNGPDASSYRLAGSKALHSETIPFTLRYRDYSITHRAGSTSPKIKPIGKAVDFCSGKNVHPSVPMISPDGLELAAEDDRGNNSTRIFKLDTQHPERCDVTLDFGIQVSKMAFDPKSSRVTFYATSFRSLPTGCGKGERRCFYERFCS